MEEVLAKIWAKMLGIERVGVYDNFFDLGAHSLTATQLVSHLRKVFRVELPLRTLFEMPTISDLSVALIKISGSPEVIEKIAITLKKLEQLSENEVKMMLAKQSFKEGEK